MNLNLKHKLYILPRKHKNWVEWLLSQEKKHIHTFRDDVADIALQIIKDIYWIHGINKACLLYSKDALHVEMFFDDTNVHVIIPFSVISDKCEDLSPLTSRDIVEEVRNGTRKAIMEAIQMK